MAYHRIEPFGDEQADFRAGLVSATIANVNRAKGSKPFTPADFMPFADKPKPQLGPMLQSALREAAAINSRKAV